MQGRLGLEPQSRPVGKKAAGLLKAAESSTY